uniref:Uncharacterized protein n=1 Tax=Dechloromonas aromatica (strain RCB) TaxID=159087 RepID=Q47CJ9_DECAR
MLLGVLSSWSFPQVITAPGMAWLEISYILRCANVNLYLKMCDAVLSSTPELIKRIGMVLSKTQQAMKLLAQGLAVKVAAEQAGIAESTLRMAMGRTKGKELCPCCGQVVREGFEINRDVLKGD